MDEATRKTLIENTIRVYREHAAALRAIIPTIEAMNGKILNKKLDDAMNAAPMPEGLQYHFNYETRFNTFTIEAYNYNRSFKETPNTPDAYACTGYVKNERATATIPDYIESFEVTPAGKTRITSAPTIEAIENAAHTYEKRAADLESADGREMFKEMQEIAERLRNFNNKYDYEVRSLYGLLYGLQYNGDSDTKDYNIKTW